MFGFARSAATAAPDVTANQNAQPATARLHYPRPVFDLNSNGSPRFQE